MQSHAHSTHNTSHPFWSDEASKRLHFKLLTIHYRTKRPKNSFLYCWFGLFRCVPYFRWRGCEVKKVPILIYIIKTWAKSRHKHGLPWHHRSTKSRRRNRVYMFIMMLMRKGKSKEGEEAMIRRAICRKYYEKPQKKACHHYGPVKSGRLRY